MVDGWPTVEVEGVEEEREGRGDGWAENKRVVGTLRLRCDL